MEFNRNKQKESSSGGFFGANIAISLKRVRQMPVAQVPPDAEFPFVNHLITSIGFKRYILGQIISNCCYFHAIRPPPGIKATDISIFKHIGYERMKNQSVIGGYDISYML